MTTKVEDYYWNPDNLHEELIEEFNKLIGAESDESADEEGGDSDKEAVGTQSTRTKSVASSNEVSTCNYTRSLIASTEIVGFYVNATT